MTSPFKSLQEDPDVCNNCFRRTHERYERNYALDTYNGEPWARHVELPDRLYPMHITGVPNDPASHGMSIVCECGCSEAIRPVSKRTALSHVGRIADRLEESDENFDRDDLFDEARRLLEQPQNQCKQDTIFDKAVRYSICHTSG